MRKTRGGRRAAENVRRPPLIPPHSLLLCCGCSEGANMERGPLDWQVKVGLVHLGSPTGPRCRGTVGGSARGTARRVSRGTHYGRSAGRYFPGLLGRETVEPPRVLARSRGGTPREAPGYGVLAARRSSDLYTYRVEQRRRSLYGAAAVAVRADLGSVATQCSTWNVPSRGDPRANRGISSLLRPTPVLAPCHRR